MKAAASKPNVRTIAAGEFKAKCLQLMDEVYENNLVLIVTKRGKPVGQFMAPPPEEKPFQSIVGRTPNIKILGDIMKPMDWPNPGEKWLRANKKSKEKKRK